MNLSTRTPVQGTPQLFETTATNTLIDWVHMLSEDAVVAQIIQSEAFVRLKHISFLGALDYIAVNNGLNKTPRTRADHSLHVAALASYISEQRGYSHDLKRHLVVAGLLHDIGHPPLSHSVEPYLRKQFGFGHHEMGEMLLAGQHKSGQKLHKILKTSLDSAFISDLIAGRANPDEGGDLFSSPINIDTIEGIIRSYRYLTDSPTALDPLQVARASFVETGSQRYRILDKFWQLKGFIYTHLITQDVGLIADQYSQVYFEETGQPLDESDLFQHEHEWKRKYHQLFDNLSDIRSVRDVPAALSNVTFKYKSRHYTIDSELLNLQRYQCSKQSAEQKLSIVPNKRKTQLTIYLS